MSWTLYQPPKFKRLVKTYGDYSLESMNVFGKELPSTCMLEIGQKLAIQSSTNTDLSPICKSLKHFEIQNLISISLMAFLLRHFLLLERIDSFFARDENLQSGIWLLHNSTGDRKTEVLFTPLVQRFSEWWSILMRVPIMSYAQRLLSQLKLISSDHHQETRIFGECLKWTVNPPIPGKYFFLKTIPLKDRILLLVIFLQRLWICWRWIESAWATFQIWSPLHHCAPKFKLFACPTILLIPTLPLMKSSPF